MRGGVIYSIFKVTFQDERVEYWKAPSHGDLRAWIVDSYNLNVLEALFLKIEEVPMTEAGGIWIKGINSGTYEGGTLLNLFKGADLGCVMLGVGD